MADRRNSPGISILIPPLFFALCLIGGIVAEWLLPLPAPLAMVPWPSRLIAGFGIAFAGFAFMGWAHKRFDTLGTPLATNRAATVLLTKGPFRFSRNPLYVGFCALLAGSGAAADSLWMLAAALMFFLYLDRFVVPREERYLRERFGADYDAYCSKVRRWL